MDPDLNYWVEIKPL